MGMRNLAALWHGHLQIALDHVLHLLSRTSTAVNVSTVTCITVDLWLSLIPPRLPGLSLHQNRGVCR